jgi:beta-lactamase class A
VAVGGLSRQEAAERLLEIYNLPVELHYNQAVIHLNPAVVDFDLNLDSMMAAADLQREGGSFWVGFWNFLWGERAAAQTVPLDASYSESLLLAYLQNEIGARYDNPASIAQPVPGTVNFDTGEEGTSIDLDNAVFQIESALRSPSNRVVNLPLRRTNPERPSLQNLQILLQQTIDLSNYDGLAGVYLLDLQNGQELHFLYERGTNPSTEPDPAFTAASIIKIPILVSAYARLDNSNPAQEALNLISGMIIDSGNDPADWLMEQVIDSSRGPLEVTEDMRALGLESTFLAGHFRLGSPLLAVYDTPGNTRPDLNTDPDLYNQTTLTEIGMLLADIYQCADTGGGALLAVFPGQITRAECQEMIDALALNQIAVLLEAGAPDGTRIAHKHGWVTDPATGVIQTMGDAGIVFTPSGDYVLAIFFHHPVQLVWEPISTLIGDLAQAVYNYYNLSASPSG